jgi:hypothetical protein
MPTTPREFRRRVEDTQDDMRAEYDAPFCEIAHQEFGIPQTPLPEDERQAIQDQWAHAGVQLPDDSIKLTSEHRDFHEAMRRMVLGFQAEGADATQMLSAGLAVGRRIGMQDASGLLNNTDTGDLTGP